MSQVITFNLQCGYIYLLSISVYVIYSYIDSFLTYCFSAKATFFWKLKHKHSYNFQSYNKHSYNFTFYLQIFHLQTFRKNGVIRKFKVQFATHEKLRLKLGNRLFTQLMKFIYLTNDS